MMNIKRKVILTQLVVELIISGSFFRFFRSYISGSFIHILSIFTGVHFKDKFKINEPTYQFYINQVYTEYVSLRS